jgi:protein-S-isoprenylcysteine O-methyltransferase Ste14
VRHALESIVMLMRHLTAILVLPCAMAIFIPIWIARRGHVVYTTPHSPAGMLGVAAGIVSMATGLALFAASLFYFWSRGRGTLAPWDPPRRFVVDGPYRFVRNPMISGVIFVILAEACILRSRPHAGWAVLFALINLVYIPAVEEPSLAARFGEPYGEYKRAVRRFLPRLRPWTAEESKRRL